MSYDAAIAAIPELLKEAQNETAREIQGFVGEHMLFTSKGSAVYPNPTDTLQVVSGKLYQSLIPKKSSNIFRVADSKGKVVVEYGSSVVYAAIHEYGGDAGRGLKTRIKPRPYFGLAIEDFRKSGRPEEIYQAKVMKALTLLFRP